MINKDKLKQHWCIPWLNDDIAFIELSELMRSLCIEWCLASQTLVDDGSYAPQVGLSIVRL